MIPLSDSAPSHRFPLITYGLILVNVCVFFQELTASDPEGFVFQYAFIPERVSLFSLATLLPFVTSLFLHAGFVHLISNMWFLRIFGDSVEAIFGWVRFFLFYILCGIFASLVQYLIFPSSTIPMLGASGAVAGVLGAYFVFFANHRIRTLLPIFGFWQVVDLPASVMLFYWFVIQLFSGVATLGITASVGGVAFFAHVGGFLSGYLLALAVRPSS